MTRHARISPEVAKNKVKSAEALLVCAYEEDEKFRDMQLEGAVSYKEFKRKVASIPKDREIILYCSSAQESDAAKRAEEVEGQGFQNVKVLGEGLKAWRKAGYRVENNG